MINLIVPDRVAAPFVVAAAHPLDDPLAAARTRVRLPLAAELLGSSLLRIRACRAAESGYADLMAEAAWARPEERHLLDKARHHIVITGDAPPVSQPGHAQAAREIARAVAASCDGVVYDAWSRQVLPHSFRFGAEDPRFFLADDWLATFVIGGEETPGGLGDDPPGNGGDDPYGPAGGAPYGSAGGPSGAGGGLRLVTAGLHRFGFPELTAARVPPGNLFAAITLLRCLAVGLLAEHWDELACRPGARHRTVAGEVWAEGRDIWRYWAAEPGHPVGGRVRVRLAPAAPPVPMAPSPTTTSPGARPRGPRSRGPRSRGPMSPDAPRFPGVPGRQCGAVAPGADLALPYLAAGPPDDFDAGPAMWWNDVVDLAMPYVPEPARRAAA